MRHISALACVMVAVTLVSCGKGTQINLAKPTKQGRIEEWLRDPKNYKPFFYNEKQKPGSTGANFRYLVTKTPTKVSLDSLTADYTADADVVLILREQNKYQAFIATYLNCAEKATETAISTEASDTSEIKNITTLVSTRQSSDDSTSVDQLASTSALTKSLGEEEGDLSDTEKFVNTSAEMVSKLNRGVLISFQEIGDSRSGMDWNVSENKLVLTGLGQGTKSLVGTRGLSLNLTFDDAMKSSGFKDTAVLSIRRHQKSYEEFHAGKPATVTSLADAQSRLKKNCKDVDSDVFKFAPLPPPNPEVPPIPEPHHHKKPAPPEPAKPHPTPKQ